MVIHLRVSYSSSDCPVGNICSSTFTNWKEKQRTKGLGYVAVLWLSITLILTAILGVPIISAIFGNPKLGIKYGILAGMSSFIFQPPLQLLFLECHSAEEQGPRVICTDQRQVNPSQTEDSTIVTIQSTPDSSFHPEEGRGIEDHRSLLLCIFIGFVVSLSTAGKYFCCPSDTCINELKLIGATLGWLGYCVNIHNLLSLSHAYTPKGPPSTSANFGRVSLRIQVVCYVNK
mmetsp:Transcript_2024/g.3860  ORF Transcript_2024/g.3860 Transcript_2024/m.3860 type:complete len:231 (+) Transcript_2024:769-1461(+)